MIKLENFKIETVLVFIIFAVSGATVFFLSYNLFYNPYAFITGFSLIFVFFLILLTIKSSQCKKYKKHKYEKYNTKIFNTIIWLLIFLITFLHYFKYNYIFIITVSAITVFILIYITKYNKISKKMQIQTLIQILAIAFLIRLSLFEITSFPIGVDPWVHNLWVNEIINYGTIISDDRYNNYPLFHVLAASISFISGCSVIDSFFYVGLLILISGVFIYTILYKNTKCHFLAVVAIIFILFSDFFIYRSVMITPMTMTIPMFTIIIYYIYRIYENTININNNFIIILLLITIALTHPVAIMATVVVLLSVLFTPIFTPRKSSKDEKKNYVTLLNYFIISIVGITIFWSQSSYNFLIIILRRFVIHSTEIAEIGGEISSGVRELSYISSIELTGFAILKILFLFSSYFIIKRKSETFLIGLIITSIVYFILIYGFSSMGIRTIMPTRWFTYLYIIMIIIGISGLKIHSRRDFKPILPIIAVLFVMAMALNFTASPYQSLFNHEPKDRFYFEDSEVYGIMFIIETDNDILFDKKVSHIINYYSDNTGNKAGETEILKLCLIRDKGECNQNNMIYNNGLATLILE